MIYQIQNNCIDLHYFYMLLNVIAFVLYSLNLSGTIAMSFSFINSKGFNFDLVYSSNEPCQM